MGKAAAPKKIAVVKPAPTPIAVPEKASRSLCPTCAEYIAPDHKVKGFEVAKGSYVLFTPEEIEAAKPGADKLVEVLSFVPASEIDPIYFESSHYILPGDGGAKAFQLIRDVLAKRKMVAIGKATMSGNEHTVIIRPFNGGLALHKMFHQTELALVEYSDSANVSSGEVELMGKLIDGMTGKFEPLQYSDRYLANIRLMAASKQAGKAAPQLVKSNAKPAMDLMGALAASVAAAKGKKAA